MGGTQGSALLSVQDLTVSLTTRSGPVRLCESVTFSIDRGEIVGLVGESGSGKTMTALSLLGLLPPKVTIEAGSIVLDGEDLRTASALRMQTLRGAKVAYIAQDATASLNPVLRIGTQIAESLRAHAGLSHSAARERALDLLTSVGIPDPPLRMRAFPHELSGGMRQRVVIAIAVACQPDLIIADEPTTALDVTVQAQILEMLTSFSTERGMAIILVSHDLGVVSGVTDRTLVMYAGRLVENLPSHHLETSARHPYTRALLAATPRLTGPVTSRFQTIPGRPPSPSERPAGCAFHPRCPAATAQCRTLPEPRMDDSGVACWHPWRAGAAQTPPSEVAK